MDDRLTIGRREGDLIKGESNAATVDTLVELKSGDLILAKTVTSLWAHMAVIVQGGRIYRSIAAGTG